MATEIPQGELIPATPYAQKKGVSPKTLDRWVKQKLIDPPVRINGRKYYRDCTDPNWRQIGDVAKAVVEKAAPR
jgi:DNA-binding transcriptional MerR regulator